MELAETKTKYIWLESFGIGVGIFFILYAYVLINGQLINVDSLRRTFGNVFLLILALYLTYPALLYFWKRRVKHYEACMYFLLQIGIGYGFVNVCLSVVSALFPNFFLKKTLVFWIIWPVIIFLTVGFLFVLKRIGEFMKAFGTVEFSNLRILGYMFLVTSMGMTIFTDYNSWIKWFVDPETLMPIISFPLTLFFFFLLGLNFHMLNDQQKKEKESLSENKD